MANLYLVRHGEPNAHWGSHPNPGLSDLGHQQAEAVAAVLVQTGATHLITSPLQRCVETAAPLERLMGSRALVEAKVAEIPVPAGTNDTRAYLTMMMAARWDDPDLDQGLLAWRAKIVETLLALQDDSVVFSHFVAINAAVSVALPSPQVMSFRPGHASVTHLQSGPDGLRLVQLGAESAIALS
jgi:broad specificity phosphatase PhoE